MYPRQFADSFWSPEIRDDALVAMSFDPDLQPVYTQVIAPACSEDNALKAVRLDFETGGDSIITSILDALVHSRLVIAEISTRRQGDPTSRNGNVMWEVGVAHAFRQFDEVILLRSDRDALLFDIGPIRVHDYARDDLQAARTVVAKLIKGRLAAIDQTKSLLVERAVRVLDPGALSMLLTQVPVTGEVFEVHPPALPQQMMARLFDLGIVAFAQDAITPDVIARVRSTKAVAPLQQYCVTAFGKAVLRRILGFSDSDVQLRDKGQREQSGAAERG